MNTNLIHTTIGENSLYLDPTTLEEIRRFIETFVGDSWRVNPKLCIFACTAIVCECKKVPAVQTNLQVPFGLSIQKAMRYYKEIGKDEFLSTVISLAQKWPTCPPMLLHKLQSLKLSLRTFKKYGLACKQLGDRLGIDETTNYYISCLFWLIYLMAKHTYNESDSIETMTCIVPFLIQQIYVSYLQLGSEEICCDTLNKFFTLPNYESQSIKSMTEKYSKQFLKILCDLYSKRYESEVQNFRFLSQKSSMVERLLDDLSNTYSKVLESTQQFAVDEMSFLQLSKDITPQAFHQKVNKNGLIISKRISFDNERSMLNEAQTPKRALASNNSKKGQSVAQTPITIRMQNLAWIRDCIEYLGQKKYENVEMYYKKYNGGNFNDFYEGLCKKIEKVIEQYSPMCKDVAKRKVEIYKFFSYCINFAIEMYSNDIEKVFKQDLPLTSIFCLCTEVFNFIYQAYSGNYSRYCEIFQINLINAFWPINWFGYFLKLPKAVDDHLYELERRFLLKEIWASDLGFKIITNHDEVIRINEKRLLQRLQQHIKCRIDEICRETIGEKMVKRVYNMVLQLIEKKPELLERNNIDQIIICSITACLSINEDSNRVSLEKIFSFYSRVSYSNLDNKEKLYDQHNNELNIVDFYNNVFLQDVQTIIQKFPDSSSFLLTPRRLLMAEKYKDGVDSTPLRLTYKESESAFLKKKMGKEQGQNYQLNLAKHIKMGNDAMMDQSEESSIYDDKNSFD